MSFQRRFTVKKKKKTFAVLVKLFELRQEPVN